MSFQSFEKQCVSDLSSEALNEADEEYFDIAVRFKKILHSSLFFHLFFITLISLEFFTAAITLTKSPKSPMMAVLLAGIFLTGFTYLILIYYFQAKRPGQYQDILRLFFESMKHSINDTYPKIIEKTLSHIDKQFQTFSNKIPLLNTLLIESNKIFNGKEATRFKEMLMHSYLRKQIHCVKESPLDFETHSKLVHGFIMLAELLKDFDDKKHACALRKAIEELHILKTLMPEDPWIYAQLAACYHDLQQFDREILMYEKLLDLHPNDEKILLRLGSLYFHHGELSKGLEIYQNLLSTDKSRASRLISLYESSIFMQDMDFKL